MTKTAKVIIGAVAVLVVVCSVIRIYSLNTDYPNPRLHEANENEQIDFLGCGFTLHKAALYREEELISQYNLDTLVPADDRYDRKILVFELTVVRNDPVVSEYMNLSYISAESGAWTNGAEPSIFQMINDFSGSIGQFDPGGEYTYHIPVELFDVQFSDESWNHLNGREFALVLSIYPEKVILAGNVSQ